MTSNNSTSKRNLDGRKNRRLSKSPKTKRRSVRKSPKTQRRSVRKSPKTQRRSGRKPSKSRRSRDLVKRKIVKNRSALNNCRNKGLKSKECKNSLRNISNVAKQNIKDIVSKINKVASSDNLKYAKMKARQDIIDRQQAAASKLLKNNQVSSIHAPNLRCNSIVRNWLDRYVNDKSHITVNEVVFLLSKNSQLHYDNVKDCIEYFNIVNNEQIILGYLFKKNPELFNVFIKLNDQHLPFFKELS